mmetsp:Transcript_14953/g.47631  ORF Transcript_14953/g.47631 Transcript_14953/m.47631 type:complete len:259 (-) Transcript_14953:353-1129(-)
MQADLTAPLGHLGRRAVHRRRPPEADRPREAKVGPPVDQRHARQGVVVVVGGLHDSPPRVPRQVVRIRPQHHGPAAPRPRAGEGLPEGDVGARDPPGGVGGERRRGGRGAVGGRHSAHEELVGPAGTIGQVRARHGEEAAVHFRVLNLEAEPRELAWARRRPARQPPRGVDIAGLEVQASAGRGFAREEGGLAALGRPKIGVFDVPRENPVRGLGANGERAVDYHVRVAGAGSALDEAAEVHVHMLLEHPARRGDLHE